MARRDGQSATAKALGIHKTNVHRWLQAAEADEVAGAVDGRVSHGKPAATVAPVRLAVVARRGRRVYTPSERARIRGYAGAHGISAAAEQLGVWPPVDSRVETPCEAACRGPDVHQPRRRF